MDLYTLKSIDKIQGKNQQITIPGVRSNNRKIIVASVFKRSIMFVLLLLLFFSIDACLTSTLHFRLTFIHCFTDTSTYLWKNRLVA